MPDLPPIGTPRSTADPSRCPVCGGDWHGAPEEPAPPADRRDVPAPPLLPRTADKLTGLDTPILGGRVTIFVLCYGDHENLAVRCLESILRGVPRNRMDLRVATNEACDGTLRYLNAIKPDVLYVNDRNRFKYPVMREIFRDALNPIVTPYLIWFDDDSHVVDPAWLSKLATRINDNHDGGSRLYGAKFVHNLNLYAKNGHRPDRWFRDASWWRNRPLLLPKTYAEAPNGSCVQFVAGGFWAMATEMIRKADVPDVRLRHNGGDITIGEQIRQAGFKICPFNDKKEFVHTSGALRRGYSEKFPWSGEASAG